MYISFLLHHIYAHNSNLLDKDAGQAYLQNLLDTYLKQVSVTLICKVNVAQNQDDYMRRQR